MIEPKRDYADFLSELSREGFGNIKWINGEDINWLQIIAYQLWCIKKELER